MERYVALLRGINVGKAKRVAMAELRALMEGLGLANVRTLLNSGNAVFDAPSGATAALAQRLKAALRETTGVEAEIIVIGAADLAATVAEHPLRAHADDDAKLLVMFAQDAAAFAPLRAFDGRDWSPDAFALGRHAAWLWCASGVLDSPVSKLVSKAMGARGTARNWATVVKLDAMARDAG